MLVMSWSKVKAEFGETGANEAFATSLQELGVISDKSCNLTTEDGDALVAKATGGVTVGYEEGEASYLVTMRIKEMDLAKLANFIDATHADGVLTVRSNIINKPYSLKLTPKNKGAIGLKARKGHLSFKPGYNEEEGNFVDVTYRILQCEDKEHYMLYRTTDADYAAATS